MTPRRLLAMALALLVACLATLLHYEVGRHAALVAPEAHAARMAAAIVAPGQGLPLSFASTSALAAAGPARQGTQAWIGTAGPWTYSTTCPTTCDGVTACVLAGGQDGGVGCWLSSAAAPIPVAAQVAASTAPLAVLAGALGWWDAGNASAAVSSWPDQTGNGNTWTTIGHNPTISTGGQGGRSYYHCNGSQGLTVAGLNVSTTGWTIWTVARTSAAGGNQFVMVSGGTSGVNVAVSGSATGVGSYENGWTDSGFTATSVKSIAVTGNGLGGAGQKLGFRAQGSVALPIVNNGGPYPGGAGGSFLCGSDNTPGNALTGDIYELAVWPSILTTAQLAALDRYAQAKYQLTATTSLLVVNGNSFMAGTGASGTTKYLGAQILGLLGTGYGSAYINSGVGAETTPNALIYAQAHSFPLYSAGIVPRMVDALCEVTNDLYFGATPAAAYANTIAYANASRAAGFRVIVNTVLSRSNAGTPAGFNASRAAYNALIRAGWPTFADGLADIASDTRIGCDGCETNAAWFSGDNVHPNDVGYAIIAGYYASAILAVP